MDFHTFSSGDYRNASLEQELASEELRRSLQDGRRALDEAEAGFRDIAGEAARAREAVEASAAATAEAATAEAVTADPPDANAHADTLAFEAPAPAGPAREPRGGQDG